MEAVRDLLKKDFLAHENIYTSKRYCLTGAELTREDAETIAGQILSNGIIQQYKVFGKDEWDKTIGADVKPAKVILDHTPGFDTMDIDSDEILAKISHERSLSLNPRDIPVIRSYFLDKKVLDERAKMGLSKPTDVVV